MIKLLFNISDTIILKLTKEDVRMIRSALIESLQELGTEGEISARMGFSKKELEVQKENLIRIYDKLEKK